MPRRPDSIPETRRKFREALQRLANDGTPTACTMRPVPFTDVRQTPDEAAELCGVGTDHECPILELCGQFGYTESVHANDMVYGGFTWRRGLPLVSQIGFEQKRGLGELRKIKPNPERKPLK